MADYFAMDSRQCAQELDSLRKIYEEYAAKGLKLDMSRGKPAPDQLDLSMDLLTITDYKGETGIDSRNYGNLEGMPEARRFFADILGAQPDEVIVGGNSSLNMMYYLIDLGWRLGFADSPAAWNACGRPKFLCPAPGYDRHFRVTEYFGFELITVPMLPTGPDMDCVEALVKDEAVKGIWCVPLYSNPDGYTYSDETVRRLARMKAAAPDFRIFWDNAYCVHHLTDTPDTLLNLLEEAKKTGKQDMVFMFASTSKISFPGSGLAFIGASAENIKFIKSQMTFQTIGYDKLNQLRHARFFKDFDGIKEHMKKHRALIEPKFRIVLDMLDKEIAPTGFGSWHKPNGGYFISFNGLDGTAKRTVELCKQAGVVLTGAGATYPYGKDPHDNNIRIAPTYPTEAELAKAMEVFCVAVKIAATESLLK